MTAFLCGLAVMVLEMAAVRAVAPYFGATNYTWTNVIGVILAALAAGYFLGGRLADRHPRPHVLNLTILLGGVVCLVLPLVIGGVSRWLLPADIGPEEALDHVYLASLAATLILFAPATLVLGAVSPMVIKLLATSDRVGGAAGRVFAASTVGSIAGTFGTTLYLIPWLGTRWTITCAGGLLVLTAVLGFLLSPRSRAGVGAASGGSALCVVLILLGLGGGPVKAAAGDGVLLAEVESAYQYLRVREFTEPAGEAGVFGGVSRLFLQINEAETAYQSVRIKEGGEWSPFTEGRYYDYYSVLPMMVGAPARGGMEVLVVGVAGGTIPLQLNHFYGDSIHVTGVEIDPAVLELAHEHFDLPRSAAWLTLRVGDGRVFLNSLPRGPLFDIVIIDAFAQEYYIPFHLATRECFMAAAGVLKPGGVLAMNVAGYLPSEPLVNGLEQTVAEVFGAVWRAPVRGYPNHMLFAVKGGTFDGDRLREASGSGAEGWAELRRLAARVADSAVLRRRIPGEAILTDDLAPVEELTDRALKGESRLLLGD